MRCAAFAVFEYIAKPVISQDIWEFDFPIPLLPIFPPKTLPSAIDSSFSAFSSSTGREK